MIDARDSALFIHVATGSLGLVLMLAGAPLIDRYAQRHARNNPLGRRT